MTDIFTASNGTRIRSRGFPHPIEVDDSTFGWQPLKHYVGGSMMHNAMAEWYRHRNDEHLGRWRDPENTNNVVYPLYDNSVRVLREATGVGETVKRRVQNANQERNISPSAKASARRYFDAHPEPKPWHDAKEGQVWILEVAGDSGSLPMIANDCGEFISSNGNPMSVTNPFIQSARRLWPSGDDDE